MRMKSIFIACIAIPIWFGSCTNTAQVKSEKEVAKNVEEPVQVASDQLGVTASFVTIDNKVVALDSLRGKVVVLNFWATWCPPCIREMPSLNSLYMDLKTNKDVVFMAIDVDEDIQGASKFMRKNKFELPLYTLYNGLPESLETTSIPMTVILDKKGHVAVKHTGMVDFSNPGVKEGLLKLVAE